MIGTANIFVSNNTTSVSDRAALSDVTLINYASAEYEYVAQQINPNQSGWQNFWAKVGDFFTLVWNAIIDFLLAFLGALINSSDFSPIIDQNGEIVGGQINIHIQ
jgi:hypothetical protein